jgi:hypothetical protein
LKEEFDFGIDGRRGAVGEEFGTIAALEQEGVAKCYFAESGTEVVDFNLCYDWGKGL